MTPALFWNYSLGEIQDLLESRSRIKIQTAKERISATHELAGLIGVYINKLFDAKNEIVIPRPWDSYPELFKAEKREFEKLQKAGQAETAKESRYIYAQRHNRIRRENGPGQQGGDETRKE